MLLLRTLSGKLTAFSLSYLNKLFIAQVFYLIYNICEWKLWKQAMGPVLVTLHQKLEITCLGKRKLSETSSHLKLAILKRENRLAISFLDNSLITTFDSCCCPSYLVSFAFELYAITNMLKSRNSTITTQPITFNSGF